jgi:hypothetical protein
MNGLWGDVYWTMHVTPESQCSYASLETNVPVSSYSAIISRVVEAFKPKRFQTIQFIDDDSRLGLALAADASLLAPALMKGYTITNVSVNQYGPGCVRQPFNHNCIHVLNLVLVGTSYRWCITSGFRDAEVKNIQGSRRWACKMRSMRRLAPCLAVM